MNAYASEDADADRLKRMPEQSEMSLLSLSRTGRPAMVEDDDDSPQPILQQQQPAPSAPPLQQQAAILHRPVARKISRPHVTIPQADTEEFYRLAHEEGIPFEHVSAAVMESHEWHRRWTRQEEEGHTQPHDDSALVFEQNAYATFLQEQRELGAKNPSPEAEEESIYERKRLRLSPREEEEDVARVRSGSGMSSLSPGSEEEEEPVAVKRNRVPSQPVQPIRPVALRIARPAPVRPPTNSHIISPHVLERQFREASGASNMSPLTIPSTGSRSSSYQHGLQTSQQALDQMHAHLVEDDVPTIISHPSRIVPMDATVLEARDGILHAMAIAGGDATSDKFQSCLEVLEMYFQGRGIDTRPPQSHATEGMWLTLTKPTFFGNLGVNDSDDPMYTLGRMSFDMFCPTSLVCSLQGNFNSVERVSDHDREALLDSVPTALKEEVQAGDTVLRTYNVVTAFTIEPHLAAFPQAPNKDVRRPIRGIMTTYGYTLPDPEHSNRHSVWITGGRIEPNDDPVDQQEWKRQFGRHPPKHGLGEKAKLLAVKLLMGATIPEHMNEDGSMDYTFTRPLGGHGMAYVDVLYVDESLRIVRGHRGTIFCFTRMHEKQEQQQAQTQD